MWAGWNSRAARYESTREGTECITTNNERFFFASGTFRASRTRRPRLPMYAPFASFGRSFDVIRTIIRVYCAPSAARTAPLVILRPSAIPSTVSMAIQPMSRGCVISLLCTT